MRTFVGNGVLVLLGVCGVAGAGELKFTDQMERLGLADPGYGWHAYHDAIVCADWDGDGDVDILVIVSSHDKGPKGGQGRLYVNLLAETGGLAFEDRTEKLVPGGTHKKIKADGRPYFIDIDADGDLDLCAISDESRPVTFVNDDGVFRMQNWGFSAQSLTPRCSYCSASSTAQSSQSLGGRYCERSNVPLPRMPSSKAASASSDRPAMRSWRISSARDFGWCFSRSSRSRYGSRRRSASISRRRS